jgi:hypothetical protein
MGSFFLLLLLQLHSKFHVLGLEFDYSNLNTRRSFANGLNAYTLTIIERFFCYNEKEYALITLNTFAFISGIHLLLRRNEAIYIVRKIHLSLKSFDSKA